MTSRRDEDFTAFVDDHRRGLLRIAYLACGSWDRAEDVVQISLAKLYEAWPRVTADGAFGYARRIVLRSRVDEWRRSWRREQTVGNVLDGVTPDRSSEAVDRLVLVRAVSALPRRQRQVIIARYFLELSVEETAVELGLSAGAVKSHCHRAVNQMRQVLGSAAMDPVGQERWASR